MQTEGGAILQTHLPLLAVKMVHFRSVASLLFSSYIAFLAAESIPRMQANDVVAKLTCYHLSLCTVMCIDHISCCAPGWN